MPAAVPIGSTFESATPLPLMVTDWGLPVALSATLSEAVLDPACVGVNVTWMEQFAPAAKLDPQVLVWANIPFEFAIEIPAMFNAAVPVLFKVTVTAELVVPTAWPANVTVDAERFATGEPCCGMLPPPPQAVHNNGENRADARLAISRAVLGLIIKSP